MSESTIDRRQVSRPEVNRYIQLARRLMIPIISLEHDRLSTFIKKTRGCCMTILGKMYLVIYIISIFCFTSVSAIAQTYEQNNKQWEDQAKNNCEMRGLVFEKLGTAWTCGSPKVSAKVEKCRNYAQRAIQQHAKTIPIENCRVPVSPRWNSDYQAHYNWCLTAQDAWLYSEEKARNDHLLKCRQPKKKFIPAPDHRWRY